MAISKTPSSNFDASFKKKRRVFGRSKKSSVSSAKVMPTKPKVETLDYNWEAKVGAGLQDPQKFSKDTLKNSKINYFSLKFWLSKKMWRYSLGLVVLTLFLLGGASAFLLSGQNQDIRQQASGEIEVDPSGQCGQDGCLATQKKVNGVCVNACDCGSTVANCQASEGGRCLNQGQCRSPFVCQNLRCVNPVPPEEQGQRQCNPGYEQGTVCGAGFNTDTQNMGGGVFCHKCVEKRKITIGANERCNAVQGCTCVGGANSGYLTQGQKCRPKKIDCFDQNSVCSSVSSNSTECSNSGPLFLSKIACDRAVCESRGAGYEYDESLQTCLFPSQTKCYYVDGRTCKSDVGTDACGVRKIRLNDGRNYYSSRQTCVERIDTTIPKKYDCYVRTTSSACNLIERDTPCNEKQNFKSYATCKANVINLEILAGYTCESGLDCKCISGPDQGKIIGKDSVCADFKDSGQTCRNDNECRGTLVCNEGTTPGLKECQQKVITEESIALTTKERCVQTSGNSLRYNQLVNNCKSPDVWSDISCSCLDAGFISGELQPGDVPGEEDQEIAQILDDDFPLQPKIAKKGCGNVWFANGTAVIDGMVADGTCEVKGGPLQQCQDGAWVNVEGGCSITNVPKPVNECLTNDNRVAAAGDCDYKEWYSGGQLVRGWQKCSSSGLWSNPATVSIGDACPTVTPTEIIDQSELEEAIAIADASSVSLATLSSCTAACPIGEDCGCPAHCLLQTTSDGLTCEGIDPGYDNYCQNLRSFTQCEITPGCEYSADGCQLQVSAIIAEDLTSQFRSENKNIVSEENERQLAVVIENELNECRQGCQSSTNVDQCTQACDGFAADAYQTYGLVAPSEETVASVPSAPGANPVAAIINFTQNAVSQIQSTTTNISNTVVGLIQNVFGGIFGGGQEVIENVIDTAGEVQEQQEIQNEAFEQARRDLFECTGIVVSSAGNYEDAVANPDQSHCSASGLSNDRICGEIFGENSDVVGIGESVSSVARDLVCEINTIKVGRVYLYDGDRPVDNFECVSCRASACTNGFVSDDANFETYSCANVAIESSGAEKSLCNQVFGSGYTSGKTESELNLLQDRCTGDTVLNYSDSVGNTKNIPCFKLDTCSF